MSGHDLDLRLNAIRPDLAAAHLKDQVTADKYITGEPRQVTADTASLRRGAGDDYALDSELLFGERVILFEERDGWGWCQSVRDQYVGYVPLAALGGVGPAATHRVSVLCSHVYPEPDIKLPPRAALKMNALVSISETKDRFAVLVDQGGYVFSNHLGTVEGAAGDFVSVAESFMGSPYLWGGRSNDGLDCSALVQLSLHAIGKNCPRDSDMQARSLGAALVADEGFENLQRGDLIFWKGHVGIMKDARTLLHATAHYMRVVSEPLVPTIRRIKESDNGDVIAVRRC